MLSAVEIFLALENTGIGDLRSRAKFKISNSLGRSMAVATLGLA